MLRYFRCHRDKKNGKNTGVLDILRGRLLIKNAISDDSTKMAGHTRGFQLPRFVQKCPAGHHGQNRSSPDTRPTRRQSTRRCVHTCPAHHARTRAPRPNPSTTPVPAHHAPPEHHARPRAPCPGRPGIDAQWGRFPVLVLCFCRDGKPHRGPFPSTPAAVEPGALAGTTLTCGDLFLVRPPLRGTDCAVSPGRRLLSPWGVGGSAAAKLARSCSPKTMF